VESYEKACKQMKIPFSREKRNFNYKIEIIHPDALKILSEKRGVKNE